MGLDKGENVGLQFSGGSTNAQLQRLTGEFHMFVQARRYQVEVGVSLPLKRRPCHRRAKLLIIGLERSIHST